jgi:glyoxylase-like metal-dependent hydrolase (beta-lactamase superfamily II)
MLDLVLAAAIAASSIVAPPVQELAPGVFLQPGAIVPERGPDGNSVIFEGPRGLVVVDTGRHSWHSDAIVAFARTRNARIAAIVNTHWHLDHSSGNGRLKAAFPSAMVYTTRAVDRALAPGGFLMRSMDAARAMRERVSPVERDEIDIFLATMDERHVLRPDVAIERSRRMRLVGRSFDVRATEGAVTDADIWLYDRRTRIAVIGDLVTLPAPFFETACPERWRAALDEVWATPFQLAVPGHGAPMTRDRFDRYRAGFGVFVDCTMSDTAAEQCANAWAAVAAELGAEAAEARAYAAYYVGFLRENGGKSPDCLAA